MKFALGFALLFVVGCGASGTALEVEITGSGTVDASFVKLLDGAYSTGDLADTLPQTVSGAAKDTGQVTAVAFLTTEGSINMKCKKDGVDGETASTSTRLQVVSLTCSK